MSERIDPVGTYKKPVGKYTEEFKQKMVELKNQGVPVSVLCKEYGVSNVSVYCWRKQRFVEKQEETQVKPENKIESVNPITTVEATLRQKLIEENKALRSVLNMLVKPVLEV